MTKKNDQPEAPSEAQPAPKRKPDAELQTMARMDRMLTALAPDAAWRVISWLRGRWETRPCPDMDGRLPPGDPAYRKGASEALDGDRR